MATLNLTVKDMACGACAEAITKAVQALDSGAAVAADPGTKVVSITTDVAADRVTQAITAAGYTVS